MEWVLVLSLAVKLGFAIGALFLARVVLKHLDKSNGIDFTEHVMSGLINSPQALAIYYGLRFVGVCLLIGMVIS